MPSRSDKWQRVRDLEDCQGILALAMDRQKTILTQAWHEGSWDRVFTEARLLGEELETLHQLLSDRWDELFERAQK